MDTDRNPLTDKELWQRVAAPAVASNGAPGTAATTVSDIEFAAWLEGRMSEAEASRIEAAMAADPVLRRSALELSEVLGQPFPAPSPRLAVRAQALIGFEGVGFEAERETRVGWLSQLVARAAGFGLPRAANFGVPRAANFGVPRAAVATLALVVAITGFMLGGGLGESYAEEKYAMASAQTTQSNDLTAFFSMDGI